MIIARVLLEKLSKKEIGKFHSKIVKHRKMEYVLKPEKKFNAKLTCAI